MSVNFFFESQNNNNKFVYIKITPGYVYSFIDNQ